MRSLILLAPFLGILVKPLDAQVMETGLTFRLYDIREPMDMLYPLVSGQTPNLDEKRSTIFFSGATDFGGLTKEFIVECHATLAVDTGGLYGFRLTSDDGSRLTVGGATIVDHDGVHAATAKTGSIFLAAGNHPLTVRFFQNQGDQVLKLEWKPPGSGDYQTIPASAFMTEAGVTRVVAPGKKNIVRAGDGSRPGNGQPLAGVHPAWDLATIHPSSFNPKVGAMAFHNDGRLFVTTFQPNQHSTPDPLPGGDGKVWALGNILGNDPQAVTVTEVASGLSEPLGMAFIHGDLYVTQRLSLTRLIDADDDGYYETHEAVSAGWQSNNYHHFHMGLAAKDGFAYSTLSTAIHFNYPGGNGPNPPNRGTIVRTHLEDGSVSYMAGGLRTPNGICVGPEGELFQTDNQGAWLPASRLNHIKQGHFYGHYNTTSGGGSPSLFASEPVTPPVVYFPQNEAANSPSEPILIPNGPFAGDLLVGEVTLGGINRVSLERIGGVWQGCVYRFTQGLEAGVNRLEWGPDGSLFVGCIGGTGNWSWNGTQTGLQRLSPKSPAPAVFEIHEVRITEDGFDIEYTQPIPASFLGDLGNFEIKQWGYVPTSAYGGEKVFEETLPVTAVAASPDRKLLSLTVPRVKTGRVVHLKADPVSDDGATLLSTEAWYTVNRIPGRAEIGQDGSFDQSQVMAYEDFGDRTGQATSLPNLDGSTGFGWAAGWTHVTGAGQRSNVTNLLREAAFRPSLGDTGFISLNERCGRNLDVSPTGAFTSVLDSFGDIGKDGSTIYLGVLFGSSDPARHYYGIELHRDGGQDAQRVLQIANEAGVSGTAARRLDLRLNNLNSGAEDFHAQTAWAGDYFILRIDFGPGNQDVARVYLNPAHHVAESEAVPVAVATGTNLAFDRISFASFGSGAQAYVDFDDLRVASSWAALVGSPLSDPYEAWAGSHDIRDLSGEAGRFEADADGDGMANGLEWMFGTNPRSANQGPALSSTVLEDGRFKIEFPIEGGVLDEVDLRFEYTSDLAGDWTSMPVTGFESGSGPNEVVVRMDESTTPWSAEFTLPALLEGSNRMFVRLTAVRRTE